MKRWLLLSVVLNLALASGLSFLLCREHHWTRRELAPETVAEEHPGSVGQPPSRAESTSGEAIRARTAPFQWSQLESSDYKGYINNLKGIGCPPQTLRDIITADVTGLYEGKRRLMRGKGPESAAELQRLDKEQALLLGELIVFIDGSQHLASADSRPALIEPATEPVASEMPIVFSQSDPAALNLNAEQLAALERLQNDFREQIGGANADTNDPAYLARWQKAQPLADERARALLGDDAFLAMQLHVLLQRDTRTSPPQQ